MHKSLVIAVIFLLSSLTHAQEWKMPQVQLKDGAKHPVVACTPEELQRLRAAWNGQGPNREPIAKLIHEADEGMKQPVVYPPRGGAHNQWYQCDACQQGLKTIDDTHHQCPKCQKIYTGAPYDDVIYDKKHTENLKRMHNAAWAYAITGKEAYAEFAKQILLGYAERYDGYAYHDASNNTDRRNTSGGKLSNQTLNESMMVADRIGPAYDLIHDSRVLTADDHAAIKNKLILPMLEGIASNPRGKSNWQTWHNAAFIVGGAAIGDASWVNRAIDDPKNGFVAQMNISVLPEGMWYENSWGYHFYTLIALTDMAEGARRLGADLWSHPMMKKMLLLPIRYTTPDGSLPRFGDDVNSRADKQTTLFELAYNVYKDPAMLPMLSEAPTFLSAMFGREVGKRPPLPKLASEILPGAGHALLRTEGPAGLGAAVAFGPPGGFHGHFDKLSFVLFGFKEELGVDPGRAASQAYRLPIHTNWYRATAAHNTVVVNGKSQAEAKGELLAYAANATHALVYAAAGDVYPGVIHRRLFAMTPAYAVVIDELTSESDAVFDWVYHNRGNAAASDIAKGPAKLDGKYIGAEFLQNIQSGKTDNVASVSFPGDKVTTQLLIDAQPNTTLFTATGPGGSVMERIPMVVARRSGKEASFAAVIEPVLNGQQPTVTSVELQRTDKGLQVRIVRTDGEERILIDGGRISFRQGDRVLLEAAPEKI